MKVNVKKLHHPTSGNETGAILTAMVNRPTTAYEKTKIELYLTDYAFHTLYPNEGLNLFSEVNSDTPSIVVIKKINDIPDTTIEI